MTIGYRLCALAPQWAWLVSWVIMAATSLASAETYHVAPDGVDAADRDGLTPATAWATLEYACDRVPAGDHRLELAAGTYTVKRSARPKSGLTITGAGRDGPLATIVTAAADWPLCESVTKQKTYPVEEHLIVLEKCRDLTLTNMVLTSPAEHRITGAVYARDAKGLTLSALTVREFRWAGVQVMYSDNVAITDCRFENASTTKFDCYGGAIMTRWIKDSQIAGCVITCDLKNAGYGYKGSGHERVRIHHNRMEVAAEFAIESAHENEYGLEIDHNYLNRCVSVPKSTQGDDPTKRGLPHSVWIHHNVMTDSYGIEGPRNHLRINDNYIRIEKTGGRVYTHHGGTNKGPIWIHHNVVENVDRAFVWMNEGLAENIHISNNTVVCSTDAGSRAGTLIDAPYGQRMGQGWVVKNNIFVAWPSQPRRLVNTDPSRSVANKLTLANNVLVGFVDVPAGNVAVPSLATLLRCEADKPWPYFAPADAGSPVVDRGVYLGLPYQGKAPDVGAYEFGKPYQAPDVPMPPRAKSP